MSNYTQTLLRASLEQLEQERQQTQPVEKTPAYVDAPVDDVVELVQARHEATTAREYVEEARAIEEGLTDIQEATELVNERGGLTQESFAYLQLALNGLTDRLGLQPVSVVPALESFQEQGRQRVSLEEIQTLISTVQEGRDRLEVRSVEAMSRLIKALMESLPNARERLEHVATVAEARQDDVSGKVIFGDGLNVALAVNGQVPEDLVAYLQRYAQLGRTLLEDYTPKAFDAAMAAATLPENVKFGSEAEFWTTVADRLKDICDPREALTEDQLELVLPNGCALFGQRHLIETKSEEENPARTRLVYFNQNRTVNEQINNPTEQEHIEPGQPGYGREAISLHDMRVIARSLLAIFECIELEKFAERGQAVRTDVMSAVSALKERFAQADTDVKIALADEVGHVVKFLDTIYLLSDWPVLNYLSNLVFTTNAFVLYVERCLALPEGAVEEPAEPVQEEVQTETPVAEEPEVVDAVEPAAADGIAPVENLDEAPAENAAETEEVAETPAEEAPTAAETGDTVTEAVEEAADETEEVAETTETTETDKVEEEEDDAADADQPVA